MTTPHEDAQRALDELPPSQADYIILDVRREVYDTIRTALTQAASREPIEGLQEAIEHYADRDFDQENVVANLRSLYESNHEAVELLALQIVLEAAKRYADSVKGE